MSAALIHPGLMQLAGLRAWGRIRLLLASFADPRKLLVSVIGALLAVVWTGNIVMSILFREQYDPAELKLWISISLSIYAAWHLVRICWERPESSIEWSTTEENNLLVGPFTRAELLRYRLLIVLSVTMIKAVIGTVLLLPDLPHAWLGFLAIGMGLGLVELFRILCDIVSVGLSDRAYRTLRAVLIFLIGVAAVRLVVDAMVATRPELTTANFPVVLQFAQNFLVAVEDAFASPVGVWMSSPFRLFANLATTKAFTQQTLVELVLSLAIVTVTGWSLFRWDRWCQRAVRQREVSSGRAIVGGRREIDVRELDQWRLPRRMIRACGGPLVWRQGVGVYRHATGVVLALIPPAILASMPLFMTRLGDTAAIINFLGGLVFYSFLLLPAAMKFDFRRDYNHLLLLQMLPLSPFRIVLGQLATPIVITTAFQYAMVAFACSVRGMTSGGVIAAVIAFPALNLAVYSWENLIFLMFPQKLKQEGIEVFLRTTVVFTAKGLAFLVGFLALFVWAMRAADIADAIRPIVPFLGDHRIVFGIGVWFMVSLVGCMLTYLAAKRFQSLDAAPQS